MGKTKKSDNVVSLDIARQNKEVKKLLNELKELKNGQKKINEMVARTILKALDLKDHYTYGHSLRVAHYALNLGIEINLPEDQLYNLEMSAMFHDIGKIGIPDAVLNKAGRLDQDEYEIMKSHPVKSYEILMEFPGFEDIAKNTLHHHERMDGKGYPHGLKGEEIPLFSRIILIADTYDSMTSTRVYRKGMSPDAAYEELETYAGTQFDAKLVKPFIEIMREKDAQSTKEFKLNIIKGTFKKAA